MAHDIQVGLVSFGKAARIFHAPLITACNGLRLTTVVERHHERSRKRYPTVHIARSTAELVADDAIDLVVIATPNTTHYELARQALRAGKHVVVDKPFTVSAAEASDLRALADERGLLLSVFHNRRWDGGFLTARRLIGEGMLGEIVEYEACFDRFRDYLKPDAWREEELPGSGLLYDLGAHLIDQALVLFGAPGAVGADLYRQREGAVVDDAFVVRLYYPEHTATLRAGMFMRRPRPHFRIVGTRGNYVKHGLDPQEAALATGRLPGVDEWGREPESAWGHLDADVAGVRIHGRVETVPGRYQAFYAGVRDAIREGAVPPVTATGGARVIAVIEHARESAARRRVLDFASPWL